MTSRRRTRNKSAEPDDMMDTLREMAATMREQATMAKWMMESLNRNAKELEFMVLNQGSRPMVRQECPKCGKSHGSKPCWTVQIVCFNCGKPGHKIFECPNKKNQQPISSPQHEGRVLTLNAEEVPQSTDPICTCNRKLAIVESTGNDSKKRLAPKGQDYNDAPPQKKQLLHNLPKDKQQLQSTTRQHCPKCGRNHEGRPCRAGQNICYRCGNPGHKIWECPDKYAKLDGSTQHKNTKN